jgi:hypothetical protein
MKPLLTKPLPLYIYNLIFGISLLLLSSCSLPRTTILQPIAQPIFQSFTLAPVQLNRTFADTSSISPQLGTIESLTTELLEQKAYTKTSPELADGIVTVLIQVGVNDASSPELVRFMKGTHGSNFPSPNPRVRNLESDYLEIKVTSAKQGRLLYAARCRLLVNQDQMLVMGALIMEVLKECLHEVLEPL